jgi:Ca-activated chloride channel family protein
VRIPFVENLFAFPAHALWFALLGVVIALLILVARARVRVLKKWNLVRSDALAYARPVNRPLKTALYVGGLLFVILAYMGPQWGQKEQALKTEGLDLCIALDLSRSMLAEDILPSRLDQAKNQLTSFLPRMGGDRVTLVAFAGSAYAASPLTADYAALINYLSPLDPSFISNQATSLEAALRTCLRALKIDDTVTPESLEWESSKLIALVTDGEDTSADTVSSPIVKRIVSLGIPVFSIAVGSAAGAKIPVRDERRQLKYYVKDRVAGGDAVTKLLDESLKKLASETQGQVFYAENGLKAWEDFYQATKKFKRSSQDAGSKFSKEHRFQIPLAIALLFLLWDFFLTEIKFPWSLFRFWRRRP